VKVLLDEMLAQRRMSGRELAARVGITEANLSLLRTGKVRGIRFATLARVCAALGCKPADILDYEYDSSDLDLEES
jgi:putative transcriptional regulator